MDVLSNLTIVGFFLILLKIGAAAAIITLLLAAALLVLEWLFDSPAVLLVFVVVAGFFAFAEWENSSVALSALASNLSSSSTYVSR